MTTERASEHAFFGVSALLFAASTAGTIAWCGSMSGGMPMPGGWTMSMAWMRMPGQTWAGAAVSFLGMWVLMMVAMKLPSLVAAVTAAITAERLAPAGESVARAIGVVVVAAGLVLITRAIG